MFKDVKSNEIPNSLKSNVMSTSDQNADMKNIMPEILNQAAVAN